MDLQGTPIGKGGDGQKVTTDPASKNPREEKPGYVAPDSLAAESQTFQENNPLSGPPGTTDARELTSSTGGIGHISGAGQTQPDYSGSGYSGGPGDAAYGGTATGAPGGADAAPGYITSVVGDLGGAPKGRNLTEGGFDGEAPAGFAEPGSEEDPGREGVRDIEAKNATTAATSGPRQGEVSGQERYGDLDSETQA